MKFKSRKDLFMIFLVYGINLLTIGFCLFLYFEEGFSNGNIVAFILLPALVVFLFGLLYTHYELSNGYFKYSTGFIINGKIEINRIREIVKGKTLRVGFKPATATKGLIIKYDKYEELYISPDTNDSFIEEILKIKSDIVITE